MSDPNLVHRLAERATTLDRVSGPPTAGVYACFLAPGAELPVVTVDPGRPLFVGVSINLASRDFGSHFAAGQTAHSGLRRTLGALLKDNLSLQAVPSGSSHRFDDAGEERLSAWMREHLRVAAEPVVNPGGVERELVRRAEPPLNLTGWANPQAAEIDARRRACADEARGARAPESTIANWRGEPVDVTHSPSGVLLLRSWADNLIHGDGAPWPPPALVARIGPPLHSIESVDAVTWSVFGPLVYADAPVRAAFLRWLLERLELRADDRVATVDLWRHADVVVHGDRSLVLLAAAWSPAPPPLQPLRDFLERRDFYADRRCVVAGVACERGEHTLRWEDVAAFPEHPARGELRAYLGWKRLHSGVPLRA